MYTGNERAILLFLFFQLAILALLACCVRYCFIFWRKKKLQDGLVRFLEKRRSLHHRRTALGRMISELEQKAAEDTSNHEALEQLGEMVKAKEGIERKLASSYSLGRDSMALCQGSMLPQYDGNSKGHSFHSFRKESVTIFNTLSETTSSSDSGSRGDDTSGSGESWQSCGEAESTEKWKGVAEDGPSSAGNFESTRESSEFASSSRTFTNPMFVERRIDGSGNEGIARRRMWLKRTLSSTN